MPKKRPHHDRKGAGGGVNGATGLGDLRGQESGGGGVGEKAKGRLELRRNGLGSLTLIEPTKKSRAARTLKWEHGTLASGATRLARSQAP